MNDLDGYRDYRTVKEYRHNGILILFLTESKYTYNEVRLKPYFFYNL